MSIHKVSVDEVQPQIQVTVNNGPGRPGSPGLSAYEIAVENGFEGTETEWLESLASEATAEAEGYANAAAQSASDAAAAAEQIHDISEQVADAEAAALAASNSASSASVSASEAASSAAAAGVSAAAASGSAGVAYNAAEAAIGAQGLAESAAGEAAASALGAFESAADAVAARDGMVTSGSVVGDDLILSTVGGGTVNAGHVVGADGDSAYDLAVAGGFTGSLSEWLDSLYGEDGDNGASAYEVAVAGGFVGTEAQWLASLEGAPGADGLNGDPTTVTGAAVRTSGASAGTVSLVKGNGVVVASVDGLVKAGTVEHVATLPAGFAPAFPQGHCFLVDAAGEWWPAYVTVTQLIVAGPPPAGTVLSGSISWKAA